MIENILLKTDARLQKDVGPNLTAQSKKRPLTKCGLSAKVCKIILQCVKLGRNFAKLSLAKKNLHFEQGCRDFNSELSRPSFSKGNQHTHSKEPFQAAKAQSRFKVTKTLFLKKSRNWCSYKIFTQIIEIDENFSGSRVLLQSSMLSANIYVWGQEFESNQWQIWISFSLGICWVCGWVVMCDYLISFLQNTNSNFKWDNLNQVRR